MANLMKNMQSMFKNIKKENPYSKRTVQIVGSCSEDINPEINKFAHEVVQHLTKGLLENGSTILSTVGSDPVGKNGLSLIYDWDILNTTYAYVKSSSFSVKCRNLLKIVSSGKSESKIPEKEKELWNGLIHDEIISIYRIPAGRGWNAGAHQRQEQEKLSDALIVIGGGEGAEHLCLLYRKHGKPVIPLNIPLGSSYGDGISNEKSAGAVLYNEAVDNPKKFIVSADQNTTTKLVNLNYKNWQNDPKGYANSIIKFLEQYITPQVFYVRLMNDNHEDYSVVESFFREVVDYVVEEKKYKIKDMISSGGQEAFLNLEIFKEISNSAIIIADSTGLRPNCFIETGFAFGLKKKVILTAKRGTAIPFDVDAIDCHFWDPDSKLTISEKREAFANFWDNNMNKPPLVPKIEV
ncbi:hypothetical protein [Methanobacterium formicicum]|uniref:ATP nucleosidase Cap17-like N-terminal domain-containing protein n=1 Tax=Methanobacterium formicicum (strain DSM 3637 / PP1) TaxID=1204725 RepID=K2RC65_METFP|nr:hypothetical protein [Methanobacterium formicicum]EKF85859.1 hypothetical protein A994_07255 [Methanobacterium formicicum DSM 3637]